MTAHAHASTVWRFLFAAMIVAVMPQPGRAQLSWKTVVNNNTLIPPSLSKAFNSYNQPAKWRSSAFAAVSGNLLSFRVAFKGIKAGGDGIYLARGPLKPTIVTLLDTTTAGQSVDADAPAESVITSLGLERDGFRDGWLVITASMASTESTEEGFAGIYATRIP